MTAPESKLARSDSDLMRFAACANDYASLITDRWDLVVKAGAGLGHGAPACFIPSTAEIELDATECCSADKPRLDRIGWALGSIDMARPKHRALIPVTTGALIHECSHSIHTLWPERFKDRFDTEPRQVIQLAMALEEGRHETRICRVVTTAKTYIQRTLNALIIPTMDRVPEDDAFAMLHAAALLLPRAYGWDAAVDNYSLSRAVERKLGDGTWDKLCSSVSGFTDFYEPSADSDETVLTVARKWWNLLPPEAKDPTPNGGAGSGEVCSAHSEHSPGESSGSGPDAIRDAKEYAAEDERNSAKADASAVVAARESEKTVGGKEATERAAKKKKNVPGGHGFSDGGRGSGVTGSRVPTPLESLTAKRLGAVIRSAQAVSKVKGPRAVPPGKLRGRSAVQWSRDRAMGTASSVDLFRGKVKGDDVPPVRIGIAMDVSGSMGKSCDMAASLGWTIAAAAWDAAALVAGTCFGARLYPYVEVGKSLSSVKTLAARDGHEVPGEAIEYLDREIDLMAGEGPRILVIISDGCFVKDEQNDKAGKWAKDFVRSGGTLIFVGRDSSRWARFGVPWPSIPSRGIYDVSANLSSLANEIGSVIRKAYSRM